MRQGPGPFVRAAKRAADVVVSATAIVVLSPILAGTALAVLVKMGRPVLFRQTRAGLHGRPFEILKFTSMTNERAPDGQLLPDEDRLTKVGRFLRSTSLDELPQLVCVLGGTMSIVGPRPLVVRYVERYNDHQRRRLDVRPGLTGLAQVSGRNALDWPARLDLDVEYVDRMSLRLDIELIVRTVAVVLRRNDVASTGHVTMPEFMGDADPADSRSHGSR